MEHVLRIKRYQEHERVNTAHMDTVIDQITAFAHADPDIRAVILEGSLAVNSQVDALSDYDVNIFALRYEKYLADDAWLGQFGLVLVYQKEQFPFDDAIIPTRLVVFQDRPRIDFSFWPLKLLAEIVQGDREYASYRNGYRILVDKDRVAERLKPPTGDGFPILKPGRDELLQTLYDFWFEAYCVAKYLYRQNLWYAKMIENRYIKDQLFKMILWYHQAENGWKPNPLIHREGKRFEKWASPEIIDAVSKCFSTYRIEDTWNSLFAMVELFTRLARKTSSHLHIAYPLQREQDVVRYLQYLKDKSASMKRETEKGTYENISSTL
jgi:aminoglycoside 6-adenylyltransferase